MTWSLSTSSAKSINSIYNTNHFNGDTVGRILKGLATILTNKRGIPIMKDTL